MDRIWVNILGLYSINVVEIYLYAMSEKNSKKLAFLISGGLEFTPPTRYFKYAVVITKQPGQTTVIFT